MRLRQRHRGRCLSSRGVRLQPGTAAWQEVFCDTTTRPAFSSRSRRCRCSRRSAPGRSEPILVRSPAPSDDAVQGHRCCPAYPPWRYPPGPCPAPAPPRPLSLQGGVRLQHGGIAACPGGIQRYHAASGVQQGVAAEVFAPFSVKVARTDLGRVARPADDAVQGAVSPYPPWRYPPVPCPVPAPPRPLSAGWCSPAARRHCPSPARCSAIRHRRVPAFSRVSPL